MKRLYYIIFILAAFGMSACTSDDGIDNGIVGGDASVRLSDKQVEFMVGGGMVVNTKSARTATDTVSRDSARVDSMVGTVTLDSTFFVRCEPFRMDTSVSSTKAVAVDVDNFSSFYLNATSGAGNSMVHSNRVFGKVGDIYKGEMFWPSSDCNFHFYASNVPLKSGSDFSKVETPVDHDVVCAGLPNPTFQQRNTFAFSHIYGRVGNVMMVVAPGLTASFQSGVIQACRSGVYDIKTGAWSSKSALESVSLGETNDTYLVPGEYDVSITFSLSDGMTVKENLTRDGRLTITGNSVNNITVQVNDVFDYSMAMSPASVDMNVKDVEDFQAILTTTLGGAIVSQNNVTANDDCAWTVDDPSVLSLVAKGSVKALKAGTTKVRATYKTKSCEASVTSTDFIETYGALSGVSISTDKVIPASGGSVSKDDITVSGTCMQEVTYASGAVGSIEIALADLTKTWSSTVSASSLGSEVHNSDFKVGTMTLTYSANGKSNTASCDVLQGKNVVTVTNYEISTISSSITSVSNSGRDNIAISGGVGTKTETFTSGGSKATSFTPNKKIEIYNGSSYVATDQAQITTTGSETKVSILANSSYVKRYFRVTYYYDGAVSRTVDIEQEAGEDSVNHYGEPMGLSISCDDIPASGGGMSSGSVSGSVTQYAYYNSAPSTPVLVSPSPDYTIVGWEFRADADNKTTVASLGTTEKSRTKVGKLTLTYKANDVVGTAVCDVYQAANVKTKVGETTYAKSDYAMQSVVLSYNSADYTYMSGGTVQNAGVLFTVAREGGTVYVSGSYTYTKTPQDNYTYTATGSTLHVESGTPQTGVVGKDFLLDYTSEFTSSYGNIAWDGSGERYVVTVNASNWVGGPGTYNVCVYMSGTGCLGYHPAFNIQESEESLTLKSLKAEVRYPGMQTAVYYGQSAEIVVTGVYQVGATSEERELPITEGVTLSSLTSSTVCALDGMNVQHKYLNLASNYNVTVRATLGDYKYTEVTVVFGGRYYDMLQVEIEEVSSMKPEGVVRWNDTKEWDELKKSGPESMGYRCTVGDTEIPFGEVAEAHEFTTDHPMFVTIEITNQIGKKIRGVLKVMSDGIKWIKVVD